MAHGLTVTAYGLRSKSRVKQVFTEVAHFVYWNLALVRSGHFKKPPNHSNNEYGHNYLASAVEFHSSHTSQLGSVQSLTRHWHPLSLNNIISLGFSVRYPHRRHPTTFGNLTTWLITRLPSLIFDLFLNQALPRGFQNALGT